jgi:hypothetical protein
MKTIDELHAKEMTEWAGGNKPKSKPCKTCKNKPEVTELPPIEEEVLVSKEDVIYLYTEMTRKTFTDEMYNRLNGIYFLLFNQPLNRCTGCGGRQYRKVKHLVDTIYK